MTTTLPDAQEVSATVETWTASHPVFADLLAGGMPPAKALLRLAFDLLEANRIPEAIAVLRSALALTPDDAVLWTNYGIALDLGNCPLEAVASLERSVSLSHHQPDTWLMVGIVKNKLGDPDEAEAAYRTALEQEPNSTAAWQLLGVLKQERKDYAGAIDCLTGCIRVGGPDAAVLATLGKLHYQLGRIPEAQDAYTQAAVLDPTNAHYRKMARRTAFLRDVLQGESIDAAMVSYQSSFSTDEIPTEKDLEELLSSAFSLLSGFGHLDAAIRVCRRQIALSPANPSIAYLLKAVTGDSTLDRAAPEYVVGHFDAFAAGFEATLVGILGYDVPEQIGSALLKMTAAGHLYDTLDAGCGTGLCGPWLRPFSRELTGADLSPKMLEQAGQRKLYDTLVCEELTAYLGRSPGRFDLIVAADVMVYFGDLAPVFAAAATALRPGGLLTFSTESWTGDGYRLQPSGRFAHAAGYVRSVAAPVFVECVGVETTLRMEATERNPGHLFIFRRH